MGILDNVVCVIGEWSGESLGNRMVVEFEAVEICRVRGISADFRLVEGVARPGCLVGEQRLYKLSDGRLIVYHDYVNEVKSTGLHPVFVSVLEEVTESNLLCDNSKYEKLGKMYSEIKTKMTLDDALQFCKQNKLI